MWPDRLRLHLARLHREQDGVALIFALFAVLVIGGLVVLMVAQAVNESGFSRTSRDFESAIHVAEAGADEVIARINDEGEDLASQVITDGTDPVNGRSGRHMYTPPTGLSDDDLQEWEENWATQLALADTGDVVRTGRGDAYGIRPCLDTDGDGSCDEAMKSVFGVGFVPAYDHPRVRTRVVKLQFDRRFFTPLFALHTGGNLDFGGNAAITTSGCDPSAPTPETCDANVHANGDLSTSGSAHEIQGGVTVSGTISGSVNATGGSSSGEDPQDVPPIQARDFYNRPGPYNPDPGGDPVNWYDLCPDATVREPSTSGPCTGTQIWPDPASPSTRFRGWSPKKSPTTGKVTVWEAPNGVSAGIFYVYHSDAAINGTAGTTTRAVTVLVEVDGTDATTKAASGALQVTGNPTMSSALPDVQFIVDRDLMMKGRSAGGSPCDPTTTTCPPDQSYSGFISVREQVDVSGTVRLVGAISVEDVEDVHKLVQRTNDGVNGTMILDYDDTLNVDLVGAVTVEFFNEL